MQSRFQHHQRHIQPGLPAELRSMRRHAFGVPNGFSLPFVSGAAFEGLIDSQKDPYTEHDAIHRSAQHPDPQSSRNTWQRTIRSNSMPSWNVTPGADLLFRNRLQSRFPVVHGRLQSLQHHARNFCKQPAIPWSIRMASSAIRSSAAATVSSCRIFPTSIPGSSARNSAWHRISGPLNFSAGGNYLHYETEENYYVFSNTFTMISLDQCLQRSHYTSRVSPIDLVLSARTAKAIPAPANGRRHSHRMRRNISIQIRSATLDDDGPQLFPEQEPLRAQFLCRCSARPITTSRPI